MEAEFNLVRVIRKWEMVLSSSYRGVIWFYQLSCNVNWPPGRCSKADVISVNKCVSSLYISIHVGQDFCFIWWLLKEPFVSESKHI